MSPRYEGKPTRLGADPLHMLFDEVAGPVGGSAAEDAAGVFCCGLRVVSMDGSTTDLPNTPENDERFGRPSPADGAVGPTRRRARRPTPADPLPDRGPGRPRSCAVPSLRPDDRRRRRRPGRVRPRRRMIVQRGLTVNPGIAKRR